MIFTDLLIIICISCISGVLLEYIPKALKTKNLNKTVAELNKSALTQKITPIARNEAQQKKDNVFVLENGDAYGVFIKLVTEIEYSLKMIADSISMKTISLSTLEIINLLLKKGIVDSVIANGLRNIWNMRNRLIHGYISNEEEIEISSDLAVTLLSILYSLRLNLKEDRKKNN